MSEQSIKIIESFIWHWKLKRQTATLISTAIIAVARNRDSIDIAKTRGILMAYNAAGLIDENTTQEGHALLDKIVKAETEREAIDTILNYFYYHECR